jgi:hypothetical protein
VRHYIILMFFTNGIKITNIVICHPDATIIDINGEKQIQDTLKSLQAFNDD